MSPLADIFNDIVKTLGGTPIDYRKKEGKRVALGTFLVGFGNNPYGSGLYEKGINQNCVSIFPPISIARTACSLR